MKVFYNELMSVEDNPGISPSARKPAAAVKSWQTIVPVEIMPVTPVTAEELELAHEKEYIEDVLSYKINNGFYNKIKAVTDSLLWTNGSFVSAAKHAAQNKVCTVSPTSGFHHAEYYAGGGFCTFNGLVLAAMMLKEQKLISKVAIADLDMHYGNGTENILERYGDDSAFVSHYTFGGHLDTLGLGANVVEFGKLYNKLLLPKIISDLIDGVDILFYQAGADPHIDDPFGGLFTTEELKERDRIVFTIAKEKNIPVVWNLAGGYQTDFEKVLEIHNNTALLHTEIFES